MKNSALTFKDIFSIQNANILHVANIAGGFGKGFAEQITKHYPIVRQEYKHLYKTKQLKLGNFIPHTECSGQRVISLLAMPDYRRPFDSRNKVYLDYEALRASLTAFKEWNSNDKLVVLPYNMGAGNAGGDWDTITAMLDEIFDLYIVCKKKPNRKVE